MKKNKKLKKSHSKMARGGATAPAPAPSPSPAPVCVPGQIVTMPNGKKAKSVCDTH